MAATNYYTNLPANQPDPADDDIYAFSDADEARAAREDWLSMQDAQQQGQQAGTRAGEAITTLQQYVPGLFGAGSSASSFSGSAGAGARAQMPQIMPSGYTGAGSGAGAAAPPVASLNTKAAEDAAFARAKDKIGQIGAGSLTSLRSLLANSGRLGSGAEDMAVSNLMSSTAGDLAEAARDWTLSDVERIRRAGEMNYQGNITQRGQDLSAQQAMNALNARLAEAAYQGEITQRGQDLAAARDEMSFASSQQEQQQFILDRLISSLSGLY